MLVSRKANFTADSSKKESYLQSRIIKSLDILEGTSKDHLVEPFVEKDAKMRLSALSICILKNPIDGDFQRRFSSSSRRQKIICLFLAVGVN